ncbi:hypothetical protein [Kitasatospora aureofaciens]|uniref:hypothetical protein n=1 Tax=Kitasatospora aureofaciens TaxID=1894 RepID=UPI000A52CA34
MTAAVLSHLLLGFHLTFLAKDEPTAPQPSHTTHPAPAPAPAPAPSRRGPVLLFTAAASYSRAVVSRSIRTSPRTRHSRKVSRQCGAAGRSRGRRAL